MSGNAIPKNSKQPLNIAYKTRLIKTWSNAFSFENRYLGKKTFISIFTVKRWAEFGISYIL